MDSVELQAAVDQLHWWHQIDLGQGIVTPGRDKSAEKLATLHFPDSFEGRTVMDVGTYDGFFAFEAERRGAARVVATDSWVWQNWGRDTFDLARRALGSQVVDIEVEILDHSPETVGTFDVVFFLGVLYHMRHPLLSLERMAAVTKEMLIVETLIDCMDTDQPMAAFYPADSLEGDPTNWWGPNVPAVKAMLLEVGFSRVEVVHEQRHVTGLAGAAQRITGKAGASQGRGVFHAYK